MSWFWNNSAAFAEMEVIKVKRHLHMISMCVLALGLLSGCGGEFAEETETGTDASRALTGAAVSEHDVSGQAVSGQAVQYYYQMQEEGSVTRICLETGEEKRIPIDGIDRIIYLGKDALYYTKLADDNEDYWYSLWRAPIERQADGSEEPETDRAEKVKGLSHMCYGNDIYMDEKYIVYSAAEENVIRYDRGSGKKVSLPHSRPVREWLAASEIDRICRYGDRLDFMGDCGLVIWDMKTDKVCVYSDYDCPDGVASITGEDAGFLALSESESERGALEGTLEILRIDMSTGNKLEFISGQEIMDVLEKEAGVQVKQLDYMDVNALYYDDGCLYVEVGVTYADGDDGDLVLKRRNETGSSLEYEKGLSEYMRAEREKISGHAECFSIRQGRAYVQCWDQESDRSAEMMVYDLKTGEAGRASWKDGLIFQHR